MFSSAAADRLRGCAVGATAGVLAIAAHGIGGGGRPSDAAFTALVALSATAGAAAATVRGRNPATMLALLVAAQTGGHFLLGAVTDAPHVHHTPVPMLVAHMVATLLCGALIVVGDRLMAGLSRLIGVVTTSPQLPVIHRPARIRSHATDRAPIDSHACAAPRGPPLVCAL